MARTKKEPIEAEKAEVKEVDKPESDDTLELGKTLYGEFLEYENSIREEAKEDISIYDGKGIWPDDLENARQQDNRPCMRISDMGLRVHQITNDVRQNRPSIKTRPVDDNADVETARIFDGIIRHIEQQSFADIAYETANLYQTVGGYGYFRIIDGYAPDDTEQRELYIKAIPNIFTVTFDPYSMSPVGDDANDVFITEQIPRKTFEREYGDDVTQWSNDPSMVNWVNGDDVTVAEWFHREKNDGKQVVIWRKMIGNRILKEKTLPISWIPVIRAAGEMLVVDGKIVFKGIIRDARDSVRMVSYNFSTYVETLGLQSKVPYVAAAGALDGFEDQWADANNSTEPVLTYNGLDVSGNPIPAPQRQQPPVASQGIMQGLMLAKDALKGTTGQYDASLGAQSNETSGKAILARQREGDVGSFHIVDNLAKAIRHAGRILIQWIPEVYDERKVARIIGEDDESKTAELSSTQKQAVKKYPQADGSIKKIYNLNVGCYDVIATVGPSYTTKRQEAADAMASVFQGNPEAFGAIGDIWMKNQDWPGADDAAKRLKAMLPPQILAATEGDDDEAIPPEAKAQIDATNAKLQEAAQLLQENQAENEQLQQAANDKQGDLQLKSRELDIREQELQLRKYEIDINAQSMLEKERIVQAGKVETADIQQETDIQLQSMKDVMEQQRIHIEKQSLALQEQAQAIESQQASLAHAMDMINALKPQEKKQDSNGSA